MIMGHGRPRSTSGGVLSGAEDSAELSGVVR